MNKKKYMELIKNFINKNINAEEFSIKYFELFQSDFEKNIQENVHQIFAELSYDTEEYCDDPSLREPGEIDEKGLLESAKRTLKKLKELGIE